jgi:hypothetical protein
MCALTCLLFWYYECFFKLLICKHAFVVFNCYFFECRVCRSKAQQSLCCICCFDMSTFNKTYKPELVTTRHSYSYRYNLSYLILLHLQSCDSYNLHDLYAIFYTNIWLILSVKRTPYEYLNVHV